MRNIDAIIIHCSATRSGQDLRAKDIDRIHKARGFKQIGYNFGGKRSSTLNGWSAL